MKNKNPILLIAALLIVGTKHFAQLKVFTGGSVTIGSTTSPGGYGVNNIIYGGKTVYMSTATGFATSALIRGNNNYSGPTTPDYTWWGDDQSGIYHPANNVIGFGVNGAERMRINHSGHLNINTTNTDAYLTINASDYRAATFSVTLSSDWASGSCITHVNKANSGNYEVRLSGTTKFYVAGAGWIYSDGNYLGSDLNIKDDVKTIDSAMHKLKKMKGVTYKLKVEKQNPNIYGPAKSHMGLIAQDVELAAPEVVKTLPNGTKAVCYEKLVGLLIEALKEQNAKISQLESDINNCCNKNQNRIINGGGNPGGAVDQSEGSYIKQNAPNPFNKETVIEYFISEQKADASVLIMDMNGRLLKTLKLNNGGKGNLTINRNDLNPGMYYYTLLINNREIDTKKMILTD